ncbi:MAG: hypothetical protein MK108_03125 [Mariniblastus sp.]|nr:hypothetical protein [Mariniblastus sp.]
MHARELAVMASWLAGHSTRLVLRREPTSCGAAQQYWTSCKGRMQRWMHALDRLEDGARYCEPERVGWPAVKIVLEEILLSEVLTRTWAALVSDREKSCPDAGMRLVALNVHAQQSVARNRALRLLVAADPCRERTAGRINQLRVQLERWSDLLLSRLSNPGVGARFAFDARRMMNFRPLRGPRRGAVPCGEPGWSSQVFSDDLCNSTGRTAANPDWNRKIASGVMACLEADRFETQGWPGLTDRGWIETEGADPRVNLDGPTSDACRKRDAR